jgi:dCTP deaminase
MTLLRKEDLKAALAQPDLDRRLIVTPLLAEPRQLGPASIDLRLGTKFLFLRRVLDSGLDPGRKPQAAMDKGQDKARVPLGESLWLHPGQFVLGATLEFIRMPPHLGAYVVGRSSWGRVGLIVATAVMVQPGYTGTLTLELVNEGDSPICLYPGVRIAQLAVHELPDATKHPYARAKDAKYQADTGPEVSRLAKERREIAKIKKLARRLAR